MQLLLLLTLRPTNCKILQLPYKRFATIWKQFFFFRTLHYTRIRLCAKFENRQQSTLKLVIGYIDTELELLARYGNRNTTHKTRFRWTGSLVELVEIIYAFDELHCINDGETPINELFSFFGRLFGMEMKESHCYNAYTDMKRRKNDSRTYFLDKMRERLNLRMQCDDEKSANDANKSVC